MNKGAILISLLFLCAISKAQGQQNVNINGKVLDGNNKMPLKDVHVINKYQLSITTTNDKGEFRISANDSDILVFSYVGYQKKQISFSEINEDDFFIILLFSDTLMLEEVEIKSLGSWEQFSRDFKNIKPVPVDSAMIWLHGAKQTTGELIPPQPSPVKNPITFWYNWFQPSSRAERIIERNKRRKAEQYQMEIINNSNNQPE